MVVGGTSIFGGSGTILGTVLGLALIQLMKNGLALSGAKGDSTTIVVGVILIGAVLLNTLIQNPPERLKRLLPGQQLGLPCSSRGGDAELDQCQRSKGPARTVAVRPHEEMD